MPGEERGFTLVEVVIALALASTLILVAVSLTTTMDLSNRGVTDRLAAEHSGQATLDYIIRELQTAQNFYLDKALANSIGYRRYNGEYSILTSESGVLKRKIYNETFTILQSADDVISEGINTLSFRYFRSGDTEIAPATVSLPATEPRMFYHIQVDFSVTVGKATVSLSSAASTLNITGHVVSGFCVD